MKSVEKTILYATGKVDGKAKTWVVAIFNDLKQAKPYAAMLKLHYAARNTEPLKAMDPNAPLAGDGSHPSDVKLSASTAPYTPEVSGLDDDSVLG